MKWRTPRVGDKRERVRLAWLPVELNSGWIVWLERYVEVQERKVVWDTGGKSIGSWDTIELWDTVERKEWKP
jgi:hypothetical protein